jgi:kynureninase
MCCRRKALLLTAYLEVLLQLAGVEQTAAAAAGTTRSRTVQIVTPTDPAQRGCQLSLRVVAAAGAAPLSLHTLKQRLDVYGIVTDAREPDIVRVAPCPLYNTYQDVYTVVMALGKCLE